MARFVNGGCGELMKPLQDCLPADFFKRIGRELGCEESLRLLWPVVVGSGLARNARFKGTRGSTLIVLVLDSTWEDSLRSFEKMILETVNRFWGEEVWQAIEFVKNPRIAGLPGEKRPRVVKKTGALTPLNLSVERIADAGLRETFLASAGKYFAGQEGRKS